MSLATSIDEELGRFTPGKSQREKLLLTPPAVKLKEKNSPFTGPRRQGNLLDT